MPLFAHRWSPEDVDVDGVDLIERLAKAFGNVLRPDKTQFLGQTTCLGIGLGGPTV